MKFIDTEGDILGEIGKITALKDSFGNCLSIGDVVSVCTKGELSKFSVVVEEDDLEFILGLKYSKINDVVNYDKGWNAKLVVQVAKNL